MKNILSMTVLIAFFISSCTEEIEVAQVKTTDLFQVNEVVNVSVINDFKNGYNAQGIGQGANTHFNVDELYEVV